MVKEILQKENKILRQTAQEVPLDKITSPTIKKVLREMSEALAGQNDGVAIAAPQIGYSLRIFVVSGKVFERDFLEDREKRMSGEKNKHKAVELNKELKDTVFINPKITSLSKGKAWMPEGCLSVRPLYGKTYRSKKATVVAYDETGRKFTRGGSGLLAQIFQHETDHLNGILFIDHAKDVGEELPE